MIDTFLRAAEFIGRCYLIGLGAAFIFLVARAVLGLFWFLLTRKARLKAALWRQTRDRMAEDQSAREPVYSGLYVWSER